MIKVERSSPKPLFEAGEIVEIDPLKHENGYIVMVTGSGNFSNQFSGVTLFAPDSNDLAMLGGIGKINNDFNKSEFTKFTGKIEITQ